MFAIICNKYIMDQKLINQFHYRLEIPVKFEPRNLGNSTAYHSRYASELISKDIKNWLASLDIFISWSECFILDPNKLSTSPIHIDNPSLTNIVKMNFVYCDTPSRMNWFKLKEGSKMESGTTIVNTKYARAADTDCDLIYSAEVGKPSVINASIMHNVSHVTSIRHCYSFSLSRISTEHLLRWIEVPKVFGDFIVGN